MKLYYTIGEVAEILDETTSLVRYWSNYFSSFVKPERAGNADRMYREKDIEALKQIHFLVKGKGMTLEGAEKKMKADRKTVDNRIKVLKSLTEIRNQLLEVKRQL